MYNTGVQTGGYASPLRRGETIDLSPEDAARSASPRASWCGCARGAARWWRRCTSTTALRPGLTFMTLHFPGRGGDQHADHRRDRSEVGHGGVQGGGDPHREAVRRQPAWTARRRTRQRPPDERDAVDRLLGPPKRRGGTAARAMRPRRPDGAGRPRGATAERAPAAAGVARGAGPRRLGQPGALELHLPAAARAAGRGLGRRRPSTTCSRPSRGPPVVAHVCDDIACRPRGADALCAELEATLGPAGEAATASHLDAQPVPRPVRARAGGAGRRRPASRRVERDLAPPPQAADVVTAMAARSADVPQPRTLAPLRAAGGTSRALQLLRRVGVVDPTSLDAYRAHGGYAALRTRPRARPGGVIARGHRGQAGRPRRRGVSHRPQVGGRRARAGAAALRRVQRRRVGARHLQGPRADGGRSVRASSRR